MLSWSWRSINTVVCCLSGIFLNTKYIAPRCSPPDRQTTTTTAHRNTCCNLLSYAPDDGQIFVRNMLSWSWRSINTVICCLWGIFLNTINTAPRCRPPDRQPTTTTRHHNTCCNLQSYAPDDGQILVRNMLSWSWRSINTVICCLSGIFLNTMHIVPRCRPPDRQPTTTTAHHNTCCNLQSYGLMMGKGLSETCWVDLDDQ
jgi:hypothetical protein